MLFIIGRDKVYILYPALHASRQIYIIIIIIKIQRTDKKGKGHVL